MATVTSLTETKIRELLAGWESVDLSQDEINALVKQLRTSQDTVTAEMSELKNSTIPQFQNDLAANSAAVSDLNDNVLPSVQANLDQNNLQLQNLTTVDIPELQSGLNNEIANTAARPKVFVQPDEPPAYDDLEERDLVVGDVWYDSDDNNMHRIWNGVEWTTFKVDIPDFSLTVRKFLSTSHLIY